MDTWSARRKTIYLGLGFLILLIFVAIPTFLLVHKVPTCFDGKQNGDETGVDCGGSCQILCSFEALDPTILWSRAFRVTDSVYSAVAYIENPNINSETMATYAFSLFDANNVLIATKKGVTFVPKNKTLAIFEPNIATGLKVPARVSFEFIQEFEWRKTDQPAPPLVVTQNILSRENTSPRVDADIQNRSLKPIERIELVALVYNDQGNAIAASRTFVDRLEADQSAHVTFTWPTPFAEAEGSAVVEIIPRVIPRNW